MAFTDTPTGWFPAWAEDATDITVPIASFTGLTAATADAATGDIRKILYAILETCWAKNQALAVADRSTQMLFGKESFNDDVAETITHKYTITFVTKAADQTVADE